MKALELTIYPPAPPRPAGTGRDVGAWAENRHYERNVRIGKRLTTPELAAEYWRKNGDFESCAEGYSVANDGYTYEWEGVEAIRLNTLRRFATLPHYDEADSE